jgi:hypothetical protein
MCAAEFNKRFEQPHLPKSIKRRCHLAGETYFLAGAAMTVAVAAFIWMARIGQVEAPCSPNAALSVYASLGMAAEWQPASGTSWPVRDTANTAAIVADDEDRLVAHSAKEARAGKRGGLRVVVSC